MNSPTNHTIGQWTRWVSKACGGITLFVGALVLVGWLFHVAVLKSILAGAVSMKPNTALAFVLAGAALALLAGPPVSASRTRAGQSFALLLGLIGGLTLCEFLLGWQLGIDELLFKDDSNAAGTLIPGRMAPSTAVCLVLLGLALAGIGWEPRRGFRPAEVLALVVAVVSMSSLVEYTIGQPIVFSFSQYTRMALHTAGFFLVLSAGVLLARPAQGVLGALRSGQISPLEQGFYAAVALALLIVLAGGGWLYHAQEEQVRREVESGLQAIARLKVAQIVQWRNQCLGDATVLMGSAFFAEGVARWMADPQSEIGEKILARFRAMRQYYHYHDVVLVDGRGQALLSVPDHPSALQQETVQALAAAFRTRQPVLTDLHVPPGDATPHFEVIAPLFAGHETTAEPIGAVILQHEARQFLYPLIQSWPSPSPSAETLLVRREGDSVLFLNELRQRRDTAFKLRIPLTRREELEVMAALGKEGVFHGVDYRGVAVLSVVKRIPDTPWAMVAKVDEVEALAEWRLRAGLIVAVVAALALALAAAARMIWQQRHKYRVLSHSAEVLRKANRAYRVLSECNQVLVRAGDEPQLLRAVCELLVEHGGYRLAWIGFADEDEAKAVRPVAQAGFEEGYLDTLQITWADAEHGRGPVGAAIRTGQPVVVQDIFTDPIFALWREQAIQRGYAAAVALPLTGQGRTLGALMVYAAEPNAFDAQELKLLEGLAGDLAFGIVTLRVRAERERQEQALRQQTEELRARNEELARFNRAAVGRELRMVELKQQMNELCRQTDKPLIHRLGFLDSESQTPGDAENARDRTPKSET